MLEFFYSISVGVGIGLIHSAVLFFVLFLARTNAKKVDSRTLALMEERNELDRQKVAAIRGLQAGCSDDDVEEFIRNLNWSDQASSDEKTLVAGNIRHFFQWLKEHRQQELATRKT